MKFGADRKRLAILGVLLLVGGYVVWTNVFSSSSEGSTPAHHAVANAPGAAALPEPVDTTGASIRRRGSQNHAGDWDIVYKDPKKSVDALKVDPTLHLDLLARVQQVDVGSAQRDLFRFGDAAPTTVVGNGGPLPPVKPIKLPGPQPVPVNPTIVAGGKPAPPGIQLKYYGYANPRNNAARKRAFFLDGEDIIVASEGELIKKRYKLVKIGATSVTMEDTQFNNQQQLPLTEELAS